MESSCLSPGQDMIKIFGLIRTPCARQRTPILEVPLFMDALALHAKGRTSYRNSHTQSACVMTSINATMPVSDVRARPLCEEGRTPAGECRARGGQFSWADCCVRWHASCKIYSWLRCMRGPDLTSSRCESGCALKANAEGQRSLFCGS